MRLLLIRHGQTPANVAGELSTAHPGPGLTPLGARQAEALAAALTGSGTGAGAGVEAIYVSTLIRTHLTVAPLARALGIAPIELDGLHEIEAGELEDRSDAASVHEYHRVIAEWYLTGLDVPMAGGADGHAFFARYDRSVREIAAHGHAVAAAVSHGAAIRTWAGMRARNLDGQFILEHALANTGVVVLEGDPERGWTCVEWEGEPLGGERLDDPSAADPLGEPLL